MASTDIARTEKEIHERIIFLANLRAKQNSFLPIFRLPPEILEIIFIHGARDHYESCNGDCFTPRIPTWVNVSYVCTHWRNVALNYPTLWTYHFNLTRRWTEELLQRSKDVPSKISCIYPDGTPGLQEAKACAWWEGLGNLLGHIEHIQELRMDVPRPYLPYFSLRAPRLETLEINFRGREQRFLEITAVHTPVLRTLKLSHCLLPWDLLNLSRLKTFSISNVHFPSDIEFLTVLGSMRDLTALYLRPNLRDPLFSGDLARSPQIDLPRLSLLVVSAPLSTVLAFLSHVDIPLTARFSIELECDFGASADDSAQFYSLLAHRFTMAEQSGAIIRSLTVDTGDIVSLTWSFSERDCRPPLPEELDDDIPLQIMFLQFGDDDEQTCSIMADMCSCLPLTHVQTLYVRALWSSTSFTQILRCLDGLRYLKLEGGCIPYLSMLSLVASEPKENSDGQPQERMLVPALEEVELVRVHFPPGDDVGCNEMSQKSFLEVLSTRKGLRDRVIMVDC